MFMNKLLVFFFIFFILSCSESIPKKLNNDILSSSLKKIDSVIYTNTPVTSFFIDSLVECRPSKHFIDYKEIFKHKYFFKGESIDNLERKKFYYSYRFEELKYNVTFIYERENENWIFKGYKVLEDH